MTNFNSNFTPPTRSGDLERIGYLAVITNLNGPFARRAFDGKIHKFQTILNAKDVAVGDDAYNGTRWGKVTAKTVGSTPDYLKITVQWRDLNPAAGIDPDNHNTLRTDVYHLSVATNDSTTTQHLAFQRMDNVGVVFVRSLNPAVATNPDIELDGSEPEIKEGGADIQMAFVIGEDPLEGAIVTVFIDGEEEETTYETDSSGEVTIPNTFVYGESITFVVSYPDHNSLFIGPLEVVGIPIELDGAEPEIAEGGPNVTLTLEIDGNPVEDISVQVMVNGEEHGSAVLTNSSGVATITNDFQEGDEVTFVCTLDGHPPLIIGPITVAAAA